MIITAKEAREQIKESCRIRFEGEIIKVNQQIIAACDFGAHQCHFTVIEEYVNEIRSILVENGFSVINKGSQFTVSW